MTRLYNISHFSIALLVVISGFFLFSHTTHAALIVQPSNNLSLVGYWSFDEGSGTQAGDFSGNGNTGTLTNMENGDWVNGKRGKGLNFDGTDEYITIPNSASIGASGNKSLSAWVKLTSYSLDGSTFSTIAANREDNQGGFVFNIVGTGVLRYTLPGRSDYPTSGSVVPLNVWTHIGFSVDGDQLTIFVNGVGVLTTTILDSGLTATTQALTLATQGTTQRAVNGIMDDVRIYNRALSATEVSRLYGTGAVRHTNPSKLGLVGYWSMDEGTSTKVGDFSGTGNHGTWSSTLAWATGKRAGALNFAGTGNKVDLGTSNSLKPATTLSIAFWFKATTLDQYGMVSNHNTPNGAGDPARVGYGCGLVTDGKMLCVIFAGDWNNYVYTYAGTGLNDGRWHHVVYRYDGADYANASIYIDGVDATTSHDIGGTPSSISYDGTSTLLGDIGQGGADYAGLLDDVRVYNRVLSTPEALGLYQSGQVTVNASQNTKLTDGLVGLWSFNGPDIAGTLAYDRSGQGNNGTLTNGPTPAIGKVGQALQFDGSDDYTTNSDSSLPTGSSDRTISMWIKPSRLQLGDRLFSYGNWSVDNAFDIDFSTNEGNLALIGHTNNYSSTGAVSLNVWTHISFVLTSGTLNIYVNGILDSSQATSINTTLAGELRIGNQLATRDGAGFSGSLDEVRIYNRALSAAEVKQLYLMGK